jgi:hypothetical protein
MRLAEKLDWKRLSVVLLSSRALLSMPGDNLCCVAIPGFLSLGMSLQLSDLAASFVGVRRFGYTTVVIVGMNENRIEPVYMVAQISINARVLNTVQFRVSQ